jgi:hypothetical protein
MGILNNVPKILELYFFLEFYFFFVMLPLNYKHVTALPGQSLSQQLCAVLESGNQHMQTLLICQGIGPITRRETESCISLNLTIFLPEHQRKNAKIPNPDPNQSEIRFK